MTLTDTPEIRQAFQVNAPGSLIPTEQLRSLVDYVSHLEGEIENYKGSVNRLLKAQSRAWDEGAAIGADLERERQAAASPNPPVGGNESNGNVEPSPNPAESAAPPQLLARMELAYRAHVDPRPLSSSSHLTEADALHYFDGVYIGAMRAAHAELPPSGSALKPTPPPEVRLTDEEAYAQWIAPAKPSKGARDD